VSPSGVRDCEKPDACNEEGNSESCVQPDAESLSPVRSDRCLPRTVLAGTELASQCQAEEEREGREKKQRADKGRHHDGNQDVVAGCRLADRESLQEDRVLGNGPAGDRGRHSQGSRVTRGLVAPVPDEQKRGDAGGTQRARAAPRPL